MDGNGNDDGDQPTYHEGNEQDHNGPRPHHQPTDVVPGTVSLTQRAPIAPIPRRTDTIQLRLSGFFSLSRTHLVAQCNHCTRSLETTVQRHASAGLNTGTAGTRLSFSDTRAGFPYPPRYDELINREHLHITQTMLTTLTLGADNDFFACGIKREFETTEDGIFTRPIYVVVGFFPRGQAVPRETVVFVLKPKHLFWKLCWAAFRLRGVSGTFLSLKHVKGFRLYKVSMCTVLAVMMPDYEV